MLRTIHNAVTYSATACLQVQFAPPLEQAAIQLGKARRDHPQVVNGSHTRPKGPGHPVVWHGVNCLPLGPSGQWSSPGGKDCLYSLAVLCTAELLPRSSGVQCPHNTARLKIQPFPLDWTNVPTDPEEDS